MITPHFKDSVWLAPLGPDINVGDIRRHRSNQADWPLIDITQVTNRPSAKTLSDINIALLSSIIYTDAKESGILLFLAMSLGSCKVVTQILPRL